MMSIQYTIRHYDVYTVHYQTLCCLYSTLSDTMMYIQYIIRHTMMSIQYIIRHYDVYTVHYQTL